MPLQCLTSKTLRDARMPFVTPPNAAKSDLLNNPATHVYRLSVAVASLQYPRRLCAFVASPSRRLVWNTLNLKDRAWQLIRFCLYRSIDAHTCKSTTNDATREVEELYAVSLQFYNCDHIHSFQKEKESKKNSPAQLSPPLRRQLPCSSSPAAETNCPSARTHLYDLSSSCQSASETPASRGPCTETLYSQAYP